MANQVNEWIQWVVDRHTRDVIALHGVEFLPTSWEALGCGAFGCVMRTGSPNVVCKVSIDGSEAFLARAQARIGSPPGVCKYWEPLRVESPHGPLWIVWKQTAKMPSFEDFYHAMVRANPRDKKDLFSAKAARERENWLKSSGLKSFDLFRYLTNAGLGVSRAFVSFLEQGEAASAFPKELARHHKQAGAMFAPKESFHGWSYAEPSPSDPMLAGAVDLLAYRFHLEQLETYPIVQPLAEALAKYLRNGILLADLSADNVAHIDGVWSLIDGGFAVPMLAKWAPLWNAEHFDPKVWWDRWDMLEKLRELKPDTAA